MKRPLLLLVAALCGAAFPGNSPAAPPVVPIPSPETRPAWNQAAAEARVRAVLDVESTRTGPWDAIAWETDPAAAAARAVREQRPLFVFFFLKKNVGPDDAPC